VFLKHGQDHSYIPAARPYLNQKTNKQNPHCIPNITHWATTLPHYRGEPLLSGFWDSAPVSGHLAPDPSLLKDDEWRAPGACSAEPAQSPWVQDSYLTCCRWTFLLVLQGSGPSLQVSLLALKSINWGDWLLHMSLHPDHLSLVSSNSNLPVPSKNMDFSRGPRYPASGPLCFFTPP
jgi:hypothetical protein